ncbi:hypothetical protein K7X08_013728 [Anisodus acutangulus]|uniref:RBR-type E3 ubiquitin transferase n=1 Tax=Anisodus acutangulus TaxID=402998 RepID=A0A9Q1LPE8_9SOLA|nr:hypothetical protein K7X08_013728 [Anisodus acutangulus]
MAYKCNAICDKGKIRDFIAAKDPILGEKFDRFLLESYIEDNKRVKWCPIVPHCGNAIRIEGDNEYCEVECACGVQFYFNCLSEVHSPCSCLMWELWMSKCKDDSKTVIWMSENAKHCPKCHTPVQKNGGCNLVRCRCRCRQLFCYVQGLKKPIDNKKDLLCYTQYYEPYSAHDFGSLKAAANYMKRKLQVKLLKLEARELQSKDFSWAANGLNRLLQSRRTLSCSYPVAFYVFGKAMFANEMKPKEMEIKQKFLKICNSNLKKMLKGFQCCWKSHLLTILKISFWGQE